MLYYKGTMSLGGAIIPGGIQGVLAASLMALPEAVLATARGLGNAVNAVSDGVESMTEAVDGVMQSLAMGSGGQEIASPTVQEPAIEAPAKSVGFQVADVGKGELGELSLAAMSQTRERTGQEFFMSA